MFLRIQTINSTGSFWDNVISLKNALASSEHIVIGAGAGLSTAAGYTYSGERFEKHFGDFAEKYGFEDMYSGGFYPFACEEEKWAYWSRYIYINRYSPPPNDVYSELMRSISKKDFFVITTNVDHCFQRAGFDRARLFYTQGDYGLFQCSLPCQNVTYDNENIIKEMYHKQKDMLIPKELVPVCPNCGSRLTMNLRSDDTFVQDDGWYVAAQRYKSFIKNISENKSSVLFLELGVGYNTPSIIKYPFWQMTAENPNAVYACINYGQACAPKEIESRSIVINEDIGKTIREITSCP